MKKERTTLLRRWFTVMKEDRATEQIFWENEIKANLLLGKFILACAVGLAICWLLNMLGILSISQKYILLIFPVGIALMLVSGVICLASRGRKKWVKYLAMISLIMTLAYLDSILIFNVPLFIIIPVAFSCWYYSRSFTVQVAVLTTVFFAASAFCGAYFNMDAPDLNFVSDGMENYIRNIMLESFFPRWMIFVLISAVCYIIASRGRAMVLSQDAVSKSQARVETELDMANRIQAQALPAVSELPECRCRNFDLYAMMQPAREVGGDFYDFFYLDDTHLALIIADVADKGIAASLYMMMSKLMLDNKLALCHAPGQVLEEVNRQLHKKSLKGMFVTVWLGVLDLETGDLVTANAGHEYPIVRHGSGDFEIIRDKHGFVLGGVSSMKYRETTLRLDEGDVLFVYTDGAVEANDKDAAQFGEARLLDALNRNKDRSMEQLIAAVKQEIDRFADEAPQFDDTTMLALRLGALKNRNEIRLAPELASLDALQEFVEGAANQAPLSQMQTKKLCICTDEVFSNIVKYSGATDISVSCENCGDALKLVFRDNGSPFDPLAEAAPDPALSAKDRVRGGLGIYITKSYTDRSEYRRTDGMNVLTLAVFTQSHIGGEDKNEDR